MRLFLLQLDSSISGFFSEQLNWYPAAKARLHCEELLDDMTKARKDLDSYGQMKVHVLTNVQYDRVEHVSIAWFHEFPPAIVPWVI